MLRITNVIAAIAVVAASSGAALLVSRGVSAGSATSSLSVQTQPSTSADSSQRQFLQLPESWIPFEASVRVFSPDMPRVDGRLFRASDGSRRLETGQRGSAPQIIDIKNVPEGISFVFRRGKWSSAAMDVPEFGAKRPPRRFADDPNLRAWRYRLSFRQGEEPNVFATQGIETYIYLDRGGNVHLQAPALNMQDLVNQSVTGRREEVYNIVLKEPDPALFHPPAGAVVEQLSGTRGYRLVPLEEHEQHRLHPEQHHAERAKMYPRGDR